MPKVLLIRDVMVSHPFSVEYFERVGTAEKIMASNKVRHLPVVDRKKIYGIISDRDIRLAASVYKDRDYRLNVLIKDICLSNPYVVPETERLEVVLSNMSRRRIGSVIIAKDGIVTGIFTTTDACRLFAQYLKSGI